LHQCREKWTDLVGRQRPRLRKIRDCNHKANLGAALKSIAQGKAATCQQGGGALRYLSLAQKRNGKFLDAVDLPVDLADGKTGLYCVWAALRLAKEVSPKTIEKVWKWHGKAISTTLKDLWPDSGIIEVENERSEEIRQTLVQSKIMEPGEADNVFVAHGDKAWLLQFHDILLMAGEKPSIEEQYFSVLD